MLSLLRRYHVEEVPDPGSSAQVPDVDVPVVAGGQHDAGVKGVGLQHKHLVVVTLREGGGTRAFLEPLLTQAVSNRGTTQGTVLTSPTEPASLQVCCSHGNQQAYRCAAPMETS